MNGRRSAPLPRCLWVLLVLAFPLPGLLGQADPAVPASPGGDESNLFLDIPSVYSASKYEQKVSEAPSSVTVITADEIRGYGWRDLSEILQSVRGLYPTYDRNYEFLGIRGFSRPGDYNDRFLLLVDGVRMNDGVYGQAAIGTEFILDVDLIDRIEVIRGPGSSLYGANAFFGTINVFTKRGRDLAGAEAAGSAGSFGTVQGRLSYGERSRGVEVLASATVHDSAGQDLYFQEFDSPETNDGTARDCDRDRFHSGFFKLSAGDFSFQAAHADRTKGIPTAAFGTIFNDPDAESRDRQTLVGFAYGHTYPQRLAVLARLTYGRFDYDGTYPYWSADAPDASRIVMTDYSRAEAWTGELQLTKSFLSGHKLIGGLELRDNTRQDQGVSDLEFQLDDRRDSRNWGAFVQDEFPLSSLLVINAGVRHDDYGDQGASTHPRIALIAAPAPATTLKFVYGEAFRPPNMYELHYDDGGSSQKANPDLQPEEIRTYELVLEQRLGRHWHATANAFHQRIDRLITQEVDPADGLIQFGNMGAVETTGLEVEFETRGWRGLQGRFSYTWQETTDGDTGGLLTNSPRNLVKLNLLVPLLAQRLIAGLEGQFTDARRTLAGGDAGGYGVVNLTLSSREWVRRLEISVGAYNLLDREYGDPGAQEHVQDVLTQDGRAFRFKVAARW